MQEPTNADRFPPAVDNDDRSIHPPATKPPPGGFFIA